MRFKSLVDGWGSLSKDTQRAGYIQKYVEEYSDGKDVSLIIEDDYVDRDYLIDFSCYYSRCFEDIGKKVKRVHFVTMSKDDLLSFFTRYFSDPTLMPIEDVDQFKECYIGFATIKPLQKRSLGRTILKPYPQIDRQGRQRHFPVFNRYLVNLAGICIELESIPFQEQDRNVAACATTAIWSALGGLARVFDCAQFQSQYDITRMAFESFGNMGGRMFPNEGLYSFQILSMLTKVGYDPIYYKVSALSSSFIDNLIISYLDMGIPLLAELSLQKDRIVGGQTYTESLGHLVVILGYKCRLGDRSIEELYIHDDQIGCYSKVSFCDKEHQSWVNEWSSEGGYDRLINLSLIAPVYHKIRIPFNSVFEYVKSIFTSISEDQVEISLLTIHMFREYIITHKSSFDVCNYLSANGCSNEIGFSDLLSLSLPRYLWSARVNNGDLEIHVVFDSTSYLLEPLVVSSTKKPS